MKVDVPAEIHFFGGSRLLTANSMAAKFFERPFTCVSEFYKVENTIMTLLYE